MSQLPTGTVTFLLTDIEGSTRLWEEHPTAMSAALPEHDRIVAAAVDAHRGSVVKSRGEGDSVFTVFERPSDAIAAAAEIQRRLKAAGPLQGIEIKVRMAIHSGEAELRDGDYYGPAVNRCARVRSLAHGGQVLVSAGARNLASSLRADLAFADLGEHFLKGLDSPERVYQLTGEGLPEGFQPLTGEQRRAGNLPAAMSSFVGRERELEELRTKLEGSRLVIVTGVGGSGKTRAAVELARRVENTYDGGAWLVELADLIDPGRVPEAIAGALGVKERSGQPIVDTISEALRERPALLLLDNCEHLVHACAEVTSRLLGGCPGLKVMATSREAFNLPGEQVWQLPPLDSSEAADLFLDRAQALGITVAEAQLEAVGAICRELEGIPLAVELAAGRTRILSPTQIAERLVDRFQLLAAPGRNVNARQQTLRATIDWSYRLLAEPEAQLFEELSIFAGGFTLDAAERVCSGGDALDGLTGLVDKSLLKVDPEGPRYRLLETIRDYGRQKLGPDRATSVGARHAAYFCELGTLTARQAPAQLHPELDNLRAALRWCEANDRRLGLELAAGLGAFWPNRGFISEGRDWLVRFLTGREERDRLVAFAHHEVGWLYIWQAIFDDAVVHFRISAELARDVGDGELRARAMNSLAFVLLQQGLNSETQALIEAALPELRSSGDPLPLAQALYYLVIAGVGTSPTGVQLALLGECRKLFATAGSETDVGMAEVNIAVEHLLAGDLPAAGAALRVALPIRRRLLDNSRLSTTLATVASVVFRAGNTAAAVKLIGADLKFRREMGISLPPNFDRVFGPIREEARAAAGESSAGIEAAGAEMDDKEALAYAAAALEAAIPATV